MANKVSNFSDLIQRVTASCLLHPLGSGRRFADDVTDTHSGEDDSDYEEHNKSEKYYDDDEEDEVSPAVIEQAKGDAYKTERQMEMVMLMSEVFETVSSMKKAYVSLQEAHCPWDPDKMRLSDMAVLAEMRKLGVLRERFRRSVGKVGGGGATEATKRTVAGLTLREVVAPYEAAMEKLKTEVKSKEAEIENLREKLKTATVLNGGGSSGRKSRSHPHHQSKKKVNYSSQLQVSPSPMPEVFESCISSVKEGSKSFTSLLLSLMKSAHWDIAATVRSIEASTTTTAGAPAAVRDSIVGPNHAKYALESYVNRKIFQGFDHETFYMDGSLSSLLNPNQFRTECFTQYRDMKAMDPIELLGILPTCQFGNFCSKKYLSIVHPKMEESLFGDLEQRRQVLAGNHPRTGFYGEFLVLAKAVWLLHLLAFSLDPPPTHFEGSRGAEFHPQYMESVVRFPGGRVAAGHVVGFPVSPGFKLGNGSVVKARVYVVPKSEL
ncbi:protein GRAVITROPIC IN THE LIGHT 1-like [Cynara cardunculus var. scolymus]|uniref:protein GRAVITROPIC IN THE LIGHT 1-like n=1 Tax=Cynara cardunculus var. scolymus TaxID=59895 RepID=UPI000D6250FD|nr:protein GRAVITROPIC IN THE LIGHT 1-like [Cynara cardunculus var. scolymus]